MSDKTPPQMPFKVHPAVGNTPIELEYEADVATPAGMKRQPFRIRDGDRIFSAIMTLIHMYNEAVARLTPPADVEAMAQADVEAMAQAAVRELEKHPHPKKGK